MAKLIGWSPTTISRYENGSLQSGGHDTYFKAYLDPYTMKKALENSRDGIDEKIKKDLEDRLSELLNV